MNAAAYTAVDARRGRMKMRRWRANHAGPARLAGIMRGATGCRLDAYFDRLCVRWLPRLRSYVEDDPTGPTGVYGASKLAGERGGDGGTLPDSVVLRTAWVYSRTQGRNFRADDAERGAQDWHRLRVVGDQVGCPTTWPWIWRRAIVAIVSAPRVMAPGAPSGIYPCGRGAERRAGMGLPKRFSRSASLHGTAAMPEVTRDCHRGLAHAGAAAGEFPPGLRIAGSATYRHRAAAVAGQRRYGRWTR